MNTQVLKWRRDGDVLAAGAVGGDRQASEAWGARYLPEDEPDDGLHALIEENWYAERVDDPKDSDKVLGYQVSCQTLFQICTDPSDPGGTEVWANYVYDNMSQIYDTVGQAEAVAKHEAESSSSDDFGWDGREKF